MKRSSFRIAMLKPSDYDLCTAKYFKCLNDNNQ